MSDDGVCVVRRCDAARVLAAAQAREADEEAKRERLAMGEPSLDMYDLRRGLDDLRLKYI